MSDYAVVIAARMTSGRLPGKALIELAPGITNLSQLITRWRASRRAPVVIVATTTDEADNAIVDACAGLDVPCYRGSRQDVAVRLDGAISAYAPAAKWVARGMADNPLVDVGLADWRLDVLRHSGAEGVIYASHHSQMTYCATTDVWARPAWDRIMAESSGSQNEHPGAWYWENLDKFQTVTLLPPLAEYLLPLRTELDMPADLEMFRAVWRAWGENKDVIWCGDNRVVNTLWALDYLTAHPEVAALNGGVSLKTMSIPTYNKGSAWLCEHCEGQVGRIVAGDLVVRCARCGKSRKFYSRPPDKHRHP